MPQSYEKTRAKQKNPFFFLPRRSIFAIFDGKVTKKRAKYQIYLSFSECQVSSFRLLFVSLHHVKR
jgi:hypothetical protein